VEGWLLSGIVVATMVATVVYLIAALVKSIVNERKREKILSNWGLGIALLVLFVVTWIGHGISEWQTFKQDQEDHNQPVVVQEFVAEYSKSTLENWQSEFLQLFTMVVLASVLLHKGSAESRDSSDRIERKIDEIRSQLKKK
jgi:apolipoprotein N-acyltransferase